MYLIFFSFNFNKQIKNITPSITPLYFPWVYNNFLKIPAITCYNNFRLNFKTLQRHHFSQTSVHPLVCLSVHLPPDRHGSHVKNKKYWKNFQKINNKYLSIHFIQAQRPIFVDDRSRLAKNKIDRQTGQGVRPTWLKIALNSWLKVQSVKCLKMLTWNCWHFKSIHRHNGQVNHQANKFCIIYYNRKSWLAVVVVMVFVLAYSWRQIMRTGRRTFNITLPLFRKINAHT